jgi:cyclic pyranopterin phosphate synthase
MTPDEIKKIVEVASNFGVKKVKITGGEPLLRQDIVTVVSKIREVPYIDEVSMTTNGTLLVNYAKPLKDAGLNRVNVSLDTLNPEVYKKISGKSMVEKVRDGLFAAKEAGLFPIKINMVALKGVNSTEVWSMIDFVSKNSFILQLIELEKIRIENSQFNKYYFDLKEVEKQLEHKALSVEVRSLHNRKIYYLNNGAKVEIVRPFHRSDFCLNCSRLRVTADGRLKPCLMRNDNLVDIISFIRNGSPIDKLKQVFLEAINRREPFFIGKNA